MGLNIVQTGLRVWQFIWTLLIMALVGNMIDTAMAGNPSVVNYTMFVVAFSMFSLFYLFPASFNPDWAISPIIMIVVDALNMIFFFCAAVALPSYLHVHSCTNAGYLASNSITNGSFDMEKRCREAQASTAFLWFAWAGYLASLIISILMSRSAGSKLGSGGGSRRRPNMAQV